MSKRKNDAHEFAPLLIEIEDRPLNPLGRVVFYLVIGVVFFGILWLCIGKIDVVVSARGKIIPSGEIKILQPIETGVVSKIAVQEGDYVKKDQLLMQIDPSVSKSVLESKKRDLFITKLEISRLKALANDEHFLPKQAIYLDDIKKQIKLYMYQKNLLDETANQYRLKIDQLKSMLNSATSEIKRLNKVLEKERQILKRQESVLDIIAKREYEETEKSIINLNEQIVQSRERRDEALSKIKETEEEEKLFLTKTVSDWHSELIEKQKVERELKSQIDAISFQNRQQEIKAPISGYVGKLLVNTEGGVVSAAENLLTIIPEKSPLIIKATVLNQDIGFITLGMDASVKIDTYSFQKYGFIPATVEHIAHDAIDDEKPGPIFEVKLGPKKLDLLVEGEMKNLESGMSVTAEIKVGKRRIIEFFLYPIIKYLDEGLKVR